MARDTATDALRSNIIVSGDLPLLTDGQTPHNYNLTFMDVVQRGGGEPWDEARLATTCRPSHSNSLIDT